MQVHSEECGFTRLRDTSVQSIKNCKSSDKNASKVVLA